MKDVVFFTTLLNYSYSKKKTDEKFEFEKKLNEILASLHASFHDLNILYGFFNTGEKECKKELKKFFKKLPKGATVLIPVKECVCYPEIMTEFIKKDVTFHIMTSLENGLPLAKEIKAIDLHNQFISESLQELKTFFGSLSNVGV